MNVGLGSYGNFGMSYLDGLQKGKSFDFTTKIEKNDSFSLKQGLNADFISFNKKDKKHRYKDKIPNGHSHYEHNGARFDIYKRGDDFQHQFVYPYDFDDDAFFNEFPYLKPFVYPDEGYDYFEHFYDDLSDLDKKIVYEVLNNAYQTKENAIGIGIYGDNHSAKLTDGSTLELNLGNAGHALSVVNITSSTVIFENPWDTSIKYEISWDEFVKLGVGYLCSADLQEAKLQEKCVDMTKQENYEYDFDFLDWLNLDLKYQSKKDYSLISDRYDYNYSQNNNRNFFFESLNYKPKYNKKRVS